MNAIVCRRHGGPEVMDFVETARPAPTAGEVLIQAEAVGVNYVDTMRRSGKHPTAPKPPFTPGIELCGRVAAVGADAGDWNEGDRVIARCVSHGAYAEYVCAEGRFTVACPESMPAEDAAALFVNGQTAYHALVTRGQVRAGDNVLITAAAGGVGICAVQIAKILGARVIAAAGHEEKLQLVKNLGVDATVNYTQADWPEAIGEATDGSGADLILESVGGDIFQQCLKCWADGGRLVVYGQASGKPGVVTGDTLLFGHRAVYGLAVGKVIEDAGLLAPSMQRLFDWYEAGRFRPLVGHTFPLREAAAAHRLLESRGSKGKIVLLP